MIKGEKKASFITLNNFRCLYDFTVLIIFICVHNYLINLIIIIIIIL